MEIPEDTHDNPMIGRRVGVYELKKELGRGGMGAVFLAERADGEFYQTVAVKLIKRGMDTDLILKRFRRERQILAALNHPNIAYFLGGGSTPDGLPYFVMEYIEGAPLYRFCDENDLDVNERLKLFRQICYAVEAAHQIKVIHRDLKPSNILVKPGGKTKLLDFGIAKVLDPELSVTEIDPTSTQMRALTAEYASPEQIKGEQVTPASDIYSLGIMLYELLTGHRPYNVKRKAPSEAARIICEEEPARPSSLIVRPSLEIHQTFSPIETDKHSNRKNEPIKEDLEKIILKTLRKNSSERYQSAEDLAADITNYLEGRAVNAEYFTARAQPVAPNEGGARSIAILPFKMLGSKQTGNTGNEFLGIGLADSLVSRLSGVQRLIVRPTSSALPFSETDPFQAGSALGVDYVLNGNIRRIGNRIRVSAQLLSIAENSTSWARVFDAESVDVLELEDSISEKVAVAVLPQLTGEERRRLEKRGTNKPEAFQAYLRGRYFWNKFTNEYLLKAFESYREAIELDPNYALAHVGIADFYNWTAIFGQMPSKEAFPKAIKAAERALEIDGSLGEAYAVLAFPTFLYDWNWEESLRLIRRALELNPNFSFAHEYYSNFLSSQGLFDEALAEIKLSEELDPLSPRAMIMTAWTLYQTRNYNEAVAKARKANEMEKDFPQGWMHLGNSLVYAGHIKEGVAALRKSSELWEDSGLPRHLLCFALVADGQRDEARKVLEEILEISRRQHVKPYFIAMAYVAVGESDAAFEWFEKAIEERNEWMIWFGIDPKLDALRNDPRYTEILKRTKNPIINRQINLSAPAPITTNREKSIAVLPFNVIGAAQTGDTDDVYLSIGLADALTMRLSNIRRFVVRPTSSVISFTSDKDSFLSGKELGVEYVVEGNIRRVGDKIRVTAQLLDIKNHSTRWAEKFDEKFTDVLEFEDLISERVAKSLITSLTGEELKQIKKRGTDNSEAYKEYLRGRHYWNQFTPEGFVKALASYHRAVEIAPDYALAYAGIADYHNFLGVYAIKPFAETSAASKKAALKAISIDDTLAEAYAALGFAAQMGDFDWEAAGNHLRRSIELNPNYVLGRVWYCYYLVMRGEYDEAFAQIQRALKLDPHTPIVPQTLNWALYHSRRYAEALEATTRFTEENPNYGLGYVFLCSVLSREKQFDKALQTCQRAIKLLGRSPYTLCWLASIYAAAGNRRQALALIEEIRQMSASQYVSPYLLAMAHLNLGDKEKAFAQLNEALEIRDGRLNWLGVDPQFDALRDDARFAELLRRTNNPMFRAFQLNNTK
ncbi:MAG: Serine/threonine protein kinase [Acidobacteria bacterium]|nr:Serine/threonine protein kinase [Acidobacteriota bacterium]